MQIIALLTIVFLTAYMANVHRSLYARIIIGSVFGLVFFAVWPFVLYASDLLMWPEFYLQTSFALSCALATVFSILLVRLKHSETIGVISFSLFILITIASWFLEINIKHIIDSSFYMENKAATRQPPAGFIETSSIFNHSSGGYSIHIPQDWIKKDDLGDQFIYFQKINNNEIQAELRPMCLNKNKISLGQVVINIRNQPKQNNITPVFECSEYPGDQRSCTIYYRARDNTTVKLSQFGFNEELQKGYYLDFLIYTQDENIMTQIKNMAKSVQAVNHQSDLPACLGRADWF